MLMQDLSKRFPTWLCDVWGVVHDGHRPIASAVAALEKHRSLGGKVVFITNAPRPMDTVQFHLDEIGVSRAAYNDMVTSGDVTRELMREHGKQGLYHLGPEIDLPLFNGLGVKRVALEQASAVVCTGFFDEANETAMDYSPQLRDMKRLGLAMICANPDKVVRKGPLIVPCAGAIAEEYAMMGGEVLMAGKPFAPIYDLALLRAGVSDKSKVLAIGDGPDTDVKGAMLNGMSVMFISGGINIDADPGAAAKLKYPHADILSVMPELYWAT